MPATVELEVRLKTPHPKQQEFIDCRAKRWIIRAGRRGGKTTGLAILAVRWFLEGERVLYTAPTAEQTDKFWLEVTNALREPIDAGVYRLNQTKRFVERAGTENRIKAKTAWDADSMRGDFAGRIIYDEWQLTKQTAWTDVGAPMLLDNDGYAVFIYTPPRPGEKIKGPHAIKMYKRYKREMERGNPRYAAFHFTSHDNPHLSEVALDEITEDMDDLDYRREILAEDIEDMPGALWDREAIDASRWMGELPTLDTIVVAVDPPATVGECGIIPVGRARMSDGKYHAFILSDASMRGKPGKWGKRVVDVYKQAEADRVIGEINNGGDMIERTIKTIPGAESISYKAVRASRGKRTRAEPVASLYAQNRVHHVGDGRQFRHLEDQMCFWVPGMSQSPDRMDAMVWGVTELLLGPQGWVRGASR
jgi:hypothetical protein